MSQFEDHIRRWVENEAMLAGATCEVAMEISRDWRKLRDEWFPEGCRSLSQLRPKLIEHAKSRMRSAA